MLMRECMSVAAGVVVGEDYVEEEGGAFAGAGADYASPGDAAATPGALPDLEPSALPPNP